VSLPWVNPQQYQRDLLAAGSTAVLLVLVRDRCSGQVTVDRSGRSRVDYWPARREREAMVKVRGRRRSLHMLRLKAF
jgi:hypothetical protein